MITVINAQIYTTNGNMAYECEYSDGTKVRAVESKDGYIRKEYKAGNEWKLSGKPYIVKQDKKRAAEKIKEITKEFLSK